MSSPSRPARQFTGALALVTTIGFAVRVVYAFSVAPRSFGFDAIWYELQSQTLSHGHGYVDPDAFYRLGQAVSTANFPPLWPMLLAVANQLGLDTEHGHQLVGAVLGSVTIVLTGFIGVRVAGRRVGLVAAGLVAISPMLIAADGSLMAESLYVALITGAVLVGYHAIGSASWGWFAFQGALLGLAALARSDALFVAPLLIAACAWRVAGTSTRRRLVLAAIGVGVTGLLLVPWAVRNDRRLGDPVLLSSNSGSVIEGANCAGTYYGGLLGGWDARCLQVTRPPGQPELDWAAAGRRAGIDYGSDHLSRVPIVGAARVARAWSLWNPVAQADLEAVESRNRNWQIAAGVVTIAMLVLSVPGTIVLLRRRAVIAPLVAVAVGVSLAALAANGNTRFTLAAQPALAVAVAALVTSWLRQPSSLPTTDTNETISPG